MKKIQKILSQAATLMRNISRNAKTQEQNIKTTIMKTFITTAMAALVSISTFASCSSNRNATEGSAMPVTGTELNFKNFNAIENRGSITIVYTAGNKYSARLEERGKHMNIVKQEGETIKISSVKNNGEPNASAETYLYITAPEIRKINNYCNLSFESTKLDCGSLEIKNVGNGSFRLNEINIKENARLENAGNGNMECKKIKCSNFTLKNSGNLNTEIDVAETEGFDYDNYGNCNLEAKVSSGTVNLKNSGKIDGNLTANGTDMAVNNSGNGSIKINYKGGKASIQNNGIGDINLNINCDELKTENNGLCTIEVTGNADNVKLSGSGKANINVSGLNKY